MKYKKSLLVKKASGEIVPFSENKLLQSLKRAGASDETAATVLGEVRSQLYEGIPTGKIYRIASRLLKKIARQTAGKYHLKQAIMELGPSGFPFEKYVAGLLKAREYTIQLNQSVQGHCVTHETDVIAEKNETHYMVECKYHNQPGISCDVKVPLYIYARFKDIEQKWLELPGHATRIHQPWLITNTKFTGDAIQYGTCMGMKLMGWNYPAQENLRTLIEEMNLYPITCITSLTRYEKQLLLDRKIVLCKELNENNALLQQTGVAAARRKVVIEEAARLCSLELKHT